MSQQRTYIKVGPQIDEQPHSEPYVKRSRGASYVELDDLAGRELPDSATRQPIWHFPDRTQVTLVSYRLPPDQRPSSSDPGNPNYVRFADLADLDTLIDIYGAVRAHNPRSRVVIKPAQDLAEQRVATLLC